MLSPAVAAESCTWGILATGSDRSRYSGCGVKIAILDTGYDLRRSDLGMRIKDWQSFVPGDTNVHDLHGHGTHCTGIACGSTDTKGIRYGVAAQSDICVGKILDNSGRGAQSWAINGIGWAVSNGCKVISMSIGSPVQKGIPFIAAYERTIANAMSRGALVVAAAGNDSKRLQGMICPVSSPANCPSAVAVSAVDSDLKIAPFANGSVNPGQDVFIAAPGVDIYSSWLIEKKYLSISGTSMATPFVSGIIALLWEKHPDYGPHEIKTELRNLARSAPGMQHSDFGCGFVMAP